MSLIYCKCVEHFKQINGYVDSNYVGDVDNRRPLTYYVYTLFDNTISWRDSFQQIVALSHIGKIFSFS